LAKKDPSFDRNGDYIYILNIKQVLNNY